MNRCVLKFVFKVKNILKKFLKLPEALAAEMSGIHLVVKVKSPETTTGFLGLKK